MTRPQRFTMAARPAQAVLVGAALLGALGLAGCGSSSRPAAAAAPPCGPNAATVTVGGEAIVSGAPNQLTISLGVQTQAAAASTALAQNSAKAQALVARMKADGIPRSGLQTSGLSVQPVYNNSGNKIVGYQVTNTLTVTLDDLSKAGRVINDAAAAAGNAVRVNNFAFSLQDPTILLGRARAAAVKQAQGQARLMAQASGSALGRLCSLRDQTSDDQDQVQPTYGFSALAKAAALPPVEAGSQQVTADVTAVYQLVPKRR
jgi:uncharacterized protein